MARPVPRREGQLTAATGRRCKGLACSVARKINVRQSAIRHRLRSLLARRCPALRNGRTQVVLRDKGSFGQYGSLRSFISRTHEI